MRSVVLLVNCLLFVAGKQMNEHYFSVALPFLDVGEETQVEYLDCYGNSTVNENLTILVSTDDSQCVPKLVDSLGGSANLSTFTRTIPVTHSELDNCHTAELRSVLIAFDIMHIYWFFRCNGYTDDRFNVVSEPWTWQWFIWAIALYMLVVPAVLILTNLLSERVLRKRIDEEISNCKIDVESVIQSKERSFEQPPSMLLPLAASKSQRSSAPPLLSTNSSGVPLIVAASQNPNNPTKSELKKLAVPFHSIVPRQSGDVKEIGAGEAADGGRQLKGADANKAENDENVRNKERKSEKKAGKNNKKGGKEVKKAAKEEKKAGKEAKKSGKSERSKGNGKGDSARKNGEANDVDNNGAVGSKKKVAKQVKQEKKKKSKR